MRKSEYRKRKKKKSGLSIKKYFKLTEKNVIDNMQNRKQKVNSKTL